MSMKFKLFFPVYVLGFVYMHETDFFIASQIKAF